MPLGALLAGIAANALGAPAAVAGGALVSLAVGAVLCVRMPELRRL
jgi:hypothetical protein